MDVPHHSLKTTVYSTISLAVLLCISAEQCIFAPCIQHSSSSLILSTGQFWNIDVSLERYNDTIVKELFNRDSVNPHYVIHLDPPAPAEKRSLVGELYHKQWDRSYKPCLYAGSVQGGAGNDELKPVGTVIEGSYTDYIASGPFKHAEKFNRFNKDLCGV